MEGWGLVSQRDKLVEKAKGYALLHLNGVRYELGGEEFSRTVMLTSADFVSLVNHPVEHSIAVVACSKSKREGTLLSRDLYTSPLFKKSFHVARSITPSTYIISAKYGLIPDDMLIDSYDQKLDSLSKDQIAAWRELVTRQLDSLPEDVRTIYLFAGAKYVREFRAASRNQYDVVDILEGQSLGRRLQQLSAYEQVLERRDAAGRLYSILERKMQSGQITSFQHFSSLRLPRKGLYIFMDPSEPTAFSSRVPRIVRVGTHGVSIGSSSTLRTRLRAHFGLGNGAGNHRASIFRLHVGSALLAREKTDELSTWGKGQSAERQIRESEILHEKVVSDYLRQLLVLPIEIDDPSSAKSLRAQAERTLIGIVAGEGGSIDPPSSHWLGQYSVNATVRQSGLWNVQHVGYVPTSNEIKKALRLVDIESGSLL